MQSVFSSFPEFNIGWNDEKSAPICRARDGFMVVKAFFYRFVFLMDILIIGYPFALV